MKKNLLLGIIFFVVLGFLAKLVLENWVKNEVTKTLSGILTTPIKIASIDIGFLSSATIKGITIGDPLSPSSNMAQIEELKVNYSLLRLRRTRDPLQLINSLQISNGNINIHHSSDDRYNLIQQLKPTPPNAKPFQIPHIKIYFRKSTVTYTDERGFGPKALESPEVNVLYNAVGNVQLKKNQVMINLEGNLNRKRDNKVVINGSLQGEDFKFHIFSRKADVANLIGYFSGLKEIKFYKAISRVEAQLQSKKVQKLTDIPLDFQVSMDVKEAEFATVWVPPTMSLQAGQVFVSNRGVIFKDIQGRANGQKFSLQGDIKDFMILNLAIRSKEIDNHYSAEFLPFLKNWNLDGKCDFLLNIKSIATGNIVLEGKANNYSGHFFNYVVQKADLQFRKEKNDISLSLPLIQAYNGTGTATGSVTIIPNHTPYLDITMALKKVLLPEYFQSKHFTGQGDIDLHLDHYADDIKGQLFFWGKDASAFGQKINHMVVMWEKTPEKLVFGPGSYVAINNDESKLYFTGFLNNHAFFDITFKGNDLLTDNFYFFYSKVGDYKARFKADGRVTGVFDEAFKRNPLQHTKGLVKINVSNFAVKNSTELFSGEGTVTLDEYAYLEFALKNKTSFFNIKAKTTNKSLVYSNFTLGNVSLVNAKPFVKNQKYDFNGIASGKLTMFPDQNQLFLNNYGVTGSIQIVNGQLGSQTVQYVSGNIALQNNKFSIGAGQFVQPFSNIRLIQAEYFSSHNFSVIFDHAKIRSNEWQGYMPKNIKLSLTNLNGKLTVDGASVTADLDVETDLFIYNNVTMPNFKGHINLQNKQVRLSDFSIINKNDTYQISGYIDLDFKKQTIPKHNLEVNLTSAKLENLSELYQQLRPLWTKETIPKETKEDKRTEVFGKYNQLVKKNSLNLYSIDGGNISELLYDLKSVKQKDRLNDLPKAEGKISGILRSSYKDKWVIFSDLNVNSGRIVQTQVEQLNFQARLEDNDIHIGIKCSKVKLLESNFENLDFESFFNPDSEILKVNKLNVDFEGTTYKEILKGQINLSPLLSKTEAHRNDLDLRLNLHKDNINILSMMNSSLKRISNQGDVVLDITGPFWSPVFNSQKVSLKKFQIQFVSGFAIKAPLTVDNAELNIVDNIINIPSLEVVWQGDDTNGARNVFVASGNIAADLSFKDAANIPLIMNLTIKPTQLNLNIEDLYVGKAETEETRVQGTFLIPVTKKAKEIAKQNILEEKEEGPVLRTKAVLSDGRFIILSNRPAVVDKPAMKLDMWVYLSKGLFITGKNIGAGVNNFINNINIEFDEEPMDMHIKGSLNTIDFEKKFKLKSGKIVFMDQMFQLLEKSKQREIFSNKPENIDDNYVDIRMLPDPDYPTKRKATPYFNLKAYSIVKKVISVTDNTNIASNNMVTKIEDHVFVVYVNGFLNTPKSFAIEHYLYENNTYKLVEEKIYMDKISAEQLDTISSYLLPVLLKPQFYQNLLNKGLVNNKEANELLKSYSASQIDLWIDQQLRPFEKEIASAIGLYDVKIEHKFGEEIVNSVPVFQTDTAIDTNNSSKVSVEYIKDLFLKKLFVKLKTGVNQDPQSKSYSLQLTEYELMWFLSDFISVNYGNHNLQNSDSVYGAFSINANFDF
ncbi:MAG: hypothetical protein PHV30_01600 [Candidatus Margulisbacteria bacterium]|nr:hypothetical protein [Candidatus Margulisiibacteriota bacterium]